MRQMLLGASAMGSLTIGLHFLRFYVRRRDSLFAYFGVAFALMAVNNVGVALTSAVDEARVGLYVVRLLAFTLIIVAIVQKNRAPR